MAASIDDYEQIYQQAYKAYVQRNYEQAATLIDQVVHKVPDDPNTHLLRGHVYYVLQQYDVAKEEYLQVLALTNEQEIIDFANNGLENISQYQQQSEQDAQAEPEQNSLHSEQIFTDEELENLGDNLHDLSFNSTSFNLDSLSNIQVTDVDSSSSNPFDLSLDLTPLDSTSNQGTAANENPFANQDLEEKLTNSGEAQSELELPAFWQKNFTSEQTNGTAHKKNSLAENLSQPFSQVPPIIKEGENSTNFINDDLNLPSYLEEDETLLSGEIVPILNSTNNQIAYTNFEDFLPKAEPKPPEKSEQESLSTSDLSGKEKPFHSVKNTSQNNFDDDSFDFEAFESAFGTEVPEEANIPTNGIGTSKNIEFLDDFEEFDDLGNIPGFDFTKDSTFSKEPVLSQPINNGSGNGIAQSSVPNTDTGRDAELFSITGSQEAVPVFTQTDVTYVEPQVNVEQGFLAPLENASLQTKQWFIAGTVGVSCALVVAAVSFAAANLGAPQQRESLRNTGWAMTLTAGIVGFATTGLMGNLTMRQIRRTTRDLQTQFDAVRQGNLNVQATVYSEDELGQLATGFNEMAQVIFTTTNEATRKAQEQEEAKENLQRQVIRLLDDVEGAARGDLTVQAEVTADVLGAVADAFNLTIQNLRDIVQQVKVAAREVTKGATNSETFARALSSDALRQAEELAVTLNSVQVMTDSIQRVAEAAREAETVARDASAIALKGGEAVENTVAGILEIRETVAETTRKVKRLAESSQEISKIVALISQIASRTNLLALNASIEAARAGEAGRGFAIVADEVRQLADKSAKSLKEIEQIVMQIQSETGSVMTAMEEGTQQVIQGTKLAEEAKRSLENIIQVANRIDILVRSITTDTVEQTETSRAVAGVMQSVELTAQETSQEAQRVSGALQHLVGVSRDLISSVERFRVETAETR
ncbi:methyl-accepting chemotaxis protein [Iningainema tapete]|uniref:HAMP domain-containing protein n=1 Tax=Iningainema tapete BLCC-T55 TaxID=2748662 RepID=A0A8J6XDA9_9CYAN|nr:methyl-accepting chemotaxis protein [Iningainema tapete]MBD2771040.1 HAMP domain-containing protein [Iningainema tapete BLCC-T55]